MSFTGNQNMTRTSFSFDTQRVTLALPVEFLAPGSASLGAVLRQYVPPQGGVSPSNLSNSPGSFADAGIGGIEGVTAFCCNGVGDYTIVLQNSAQRMKRASLTLLDPENTTPVATQMRPLAGDISSGFPNMTSFYQHLLGSGIAANVTATAATQATITIASASLVTNQWASSLGQQYVFTITADSHSGNPTNAGLSAIIQSNTNATNSVLTVAGLNAFQLVTETSSADITWQVTLNGLVVATSANYTGNVAIAAYAPATWLDDAAVWNTNQMAGQTLIDSIGNTYLIVSNTNDGGAGTATLTLADVDITQNTNYIDPTGGSYQIASRTEPGQPITVCTGTASSSIGATFTPTFAANDAMFAGQFSGMVLTVYNPTVINAAGGTGSYDQWFITSNSTTILTVLPLNVAPAASQTTPYAGAWTITMTAGAASVEVLLSSSTGSGSVSGLTASAQALVGTGAATGSGLAAAAVLTIATGNTPTWGSTGTANVLTFTTSPTAFAANTLAGMILNSGTGQSSIVVSNTAITTGGGGTITVAVVSTLPSGTTSITVTPTKDTLSGSTAGGGVTGSVVVTGSTTPANPGNGEVIVIELALSASTTVG